MSDDPLPPDAVQVLSCDSLFDGHRFVGPSTVRLRGARVEAVEPGASPANGAIHVRTVLPGLIDAHAHVVGHPDGPPAQDPFRLHRNVLRLLASTGVTTVRDAGNAIETTRYAELWSAANGGPRVIATGPFLDAPPLRWASTRVVRTPGEAIAEVDRLAAEGLGWISVHRNVPLDAIAAATERARDHGMDVLADVGGIGAADLAEAGVRSVEHAPHLLDVRDVDGARPGTVVGLVQAWASVDPDSAVVEDLAERLLRAGTFVCPTLFATERWCSLDDMVHEPHLETMTAVSPHAKHFLQMRQPMGMMVGRRFLQSRLGIPSLSRGEKAEAQAGLDVLRSVVARLHRDGVPVVAGSDTPMPSVVPGHSLHQEVTRLAEAGLGTEGALAAATSAAARLLRLDGEAGVVAPGAQADLVVLDGDPATSIADTQCVAAVVIGGRPVDRAAFTDAVRQAIVTT